MPDIGNEYWAPSLTLTWRPKVNLVEHIPCSCKTVSAFAMYDPEERCGLCGGAGYTIKHHTPPKPEWPDDYEKFMVFCHRAYLKRKKRFRC